MSELHFRDGVGDAIRLGGIVLGWPAVRDGAVGAVSRADVTEDHEGCSAVFPAFADVGTARFFAHGMQIERPHELLEPQVVGSTGGADLEPARFALRERLDAMASHDLIESFAHGARNLFPPDWRGSSA